MRVYFDTSCLCRPLDDRSIPRNAVEREAILAVFAMSQRNDLTLVISEAVLIEIEDTPDEVRRNQLQALANVIPDVQGVCEETLRRGAELQQRGLKAFDALHVAAAEAAKVDFLCTGDDRLIKKCEGQSDILVRVVSPLQLFQELKR